MRVLFAMYDEEGTGTLKRCQVSKLIRFLFPDLYALFEVGHVCDSYLYIKNMVFSVAHNLDPKPRNFKPHSISVGCDNMKMQSCGMLIFNRSLIIN